MSTVTDSEAFSDLEWIHLLTLLAPSCGRILKLVYLWILQRISPNADCHPFVSLKWCYSSSFWFLSGPQTPACFLQVLPSCPAKLALPPPSGASTGSWLQREGKWVRHACRLGCRRLAGGIRR